MGMTRKEFLKGGAAAVVAAAAATVTASVPAMAAENGSAPQIKGPIVTMIANKTWCINEYGMDAQFLLEGKDKALLIDTGTGTFNIKELVEGLTKKPLMVALTHGHVDHAGGMGFFDDVYLCEKDYEMARTLTVEERRNYAEMLIAMSNGLFAVTGDDVVSFNKLPELHPLKEGDVIDLGDRKVAIYDTPGHTAGSISFLDINERIMFSGDACNINTLLFQGTISMELETAKKLKALEIFYDRNYNGHIGYAGAVNNSPQAATVNDDAIAACSGLLDGSITPADEPNAMGFTKAVHYGAFGARFNTVE